MNCIVKAASAALTSLAVLGATPACAAQIVNPTNTYGFSYLSGAPVGGQQTQYVGETFTAPITGQLTNFQFTLNSSTLNSLYGVVYAWTGSTIGAELWRSANVAGTAGLLSFSPIGVDLTQGQTYVAFLSTYGIAGDSGLATVGSCLTFAGCTSNSTPNLGTLVYGNVIGGAVSFNQIINASQDATFSATISAPRAAVPEPATWAMMLLGFGMIGTGLRRSNRNRQTVRIVHG